MSSFDPVKEDRFTFGLWTVGNPGRDPFGDPVRPRIDPNEIVRGLAACGADGAAARAAAAAPALRHAATMALYVSTSGGAAGLSAQFNSNPLGAMSLHKEDKRASRAARRYSAPAKKEEEEEPKEEIFEDEGEITLEIGSSKAKASDDEFDEFDDEFESAAAAVANVTATVLPPAAPKQASLLSCVFNLTNTVVGAGMLGLPAAFASSGLVLGAVFLLGFGCFSALGLRLLAGQGHQGGGAQAGRSRDAAREGAGGRPPRAAARGGDGGGAGGGRKGGGGGGEGQGGGGGGGPRKGGACGGPQADRIAGERRERRSRMAHIAVEILDARREIHQEGEVARVGALRKRDGLEKHLQALEHALEPGVFQRWRAGLRAVLLPVSRSVAHALMRSPHESSRLSMLLW